MIFKIFFSVKLTQHFLAFLLESLLRSGTLEKLLKNSQDFLNFGTYFMLKVVIFTFDETLICFYTFCICTAETSFILAKSRGLNVLILVL